VGYVFKKILCSILFTCNYPMYMYMYVLVNPTQIVKLLTFCKSGWKSGQKRVVKYNFFIRLINLCATGFTVG